ncbi:RAMP superfamily CRISPR-associated protein [Desulfobacter curvatus]|uniref:RAMP superfamily CRISPR-associated protein n=1 Tax=Desulfobacter curvatus TaxID=2290 RepID=UPI00036DEF34|nr:RAMP superfamily CRISPR-associated protein [Desulfobacter curvatus]
MTHLSYKIHLLSDAEPGTGLGSVSTHNYIPRDHLGRPTIPASHIKGLMREELKQIENNLPLENFSCDSILGKGGESLECQGKVRITGPVLTDEDKDDTFMITRTAIDSVTRTALDKTLRTTESLAAGRVLENGSLTVDAAEGSLEDLAVRLALRSISAVGGNRNRGSGRCRTEIAGETRSPGELLKAFLKKFSEPKAAERISKESNPVQLSGKGCWLDIVFRADQPVCCPENPTRSNAIQSGFSIPASAVMGVLLHRVNNKNRALADACFDSNEFRAWPLLPCAVNGFNGALPYSFRVSQTHRIAKHASVENFKPEYVQDHAVGPHDIGIIPADNPLKTLDGVLLQKGRETKLWKSSDMPRMIQAHGALNSSTDSLDGKVQVEGRGLYQMTSMAPMVWRGIVSIPAEMAEYVSGEWPAAFGKHRGTMGGGRLAIEETDFQAYMSGHPGMAPVFITQSPILLPRETSGKITDTFVGMINTWCKAHGLPPVETGDNKPLVWISTGICFGWNRHRNGYAGAENVVMPGSVFRLKGPLDRSNFEKALLTGLGQGRAKGFGALALHPGKAGALLNREKAEPQKKKSRDSIINAVRKIIPLRKKFLPSVSQLYALKTRVEIGGTESAIKYLNEQDERDAHIAAAWRDVKGPLKDLLESTRKDIPAAMAGIKMLADFAGSKGDEQR